MGIAVPSQLRKATQQWNPSPPLPLLPPPPLPPRLAMASASTTPTPLPASSSRSEVPPSQTPQPLSRLSPLHPELSFHASPPSSKPSLLLTSKRASARLRLSLGTDGGDTVEPPLPEELLLSDRTLSLPTTLQSRRVPPGAWTGVWSKGRPTLRPMPTMAMVDTDLAMEATAMVVLVMATARGLLTLKPMPTTAMAATDWDTDSAMEVMAMAVLATAMARGLLMPSLLWLWWSLHWLRLWRLRSWSWLWLRQVKAKAVQGNCNLIKCYKIAKMKFLKRIEKSTSFYI